LVDLRWWGAPVGFFLGRSYFLLGYGVIATAAASEPACELSRTIPRWEFEQRCEFGSRGLRPLCGV